MISHWLQTKWLQVFAVIAVVLLAAFLRLYRLDQLPPGLHYDEAFKGVVARQVLAGTERSIFFRENFTEEPMMAYAAALSFALFGESPWALRLVSALAGIATVAALYMLARALFQSHGIALLAAFVLAILYWHINFSRLGMEPILTPLMMTLGFAFLWRGLPPAPYEGRKPGWQWWGLAGIFLGATQYTYKAALFVPILVAVFIGVEIVIDRRFLVRNRRGLFIFVLAAVLVFAPLGLYFGMHPGELLERPSTVTVASSGTATLADNALKVAGMFFLRGDDNPRSNLPGRPALDPFLAIGFIAGLIACVVRIRRSESRFLLLWLIVMVMPSVLTDYAPHFGRSIASTPAIALIVACGFGALLEVSSRALSARQSSPAATGIASSPRPLLARTHRLPDVSALICVLLLVGLATSAYVAAHDYYAVWGTGTGLFDSFDVGTLSLAERMRDRPPDEVLYLSPVEQQHYTIQFGLAGRDAHSFDGRRVLVIAPSGVPAAYGIVTRDDLRSSARLGAIFPDTRIVGTVSDYLGKAYATVYRVAGAPRITPQKIIHARLEDAIELIGYDVGREENVIVLTVYWGSLVETQNDYTVFVHLIGAPDLATQSVLWAQDDARPGRGSYPTTRWQAGEIVMDEHRLAIPANLPRGDYQIEIGMYILKTAVRARVVNASGMPMESDRVVLERISLP